MDDFNQHVTEAEGEQVLKAVIVCKVIDNFGDAGFCLRLGRALAKAGQSVTLITDNLARIDAIREHPLLPRLQIIECDSDIALKKWLKSNKPNLVLDCFGSSGDGTSWITSPALQDAWPDCKWLTVDYLTAENWTENFHLIESINPANGFRSRYFYPGFSSKTGGLIHCDAPDCDEATELLKVFVFCYSNRHIDLLESTLRQFDSTVLLLTTPEEGIPDHGGNSSAPVEGKFHVKPQLVRSLADAPPSADGKSTNLSRISCGFVPQTFFDSLLVEHDFLFVRGEDSFVRAQLAGRPFVWQIYAVEDQSHWIKLKAFFDLYATGLSEPARKSLWSLWFTWNQASPLPADLQSAWGCVENHFKELARHAHQWRRQILAGPELVREILTASAELTLNQ